MFRYKVDGFKGIIMLSHVISFGYYDGEDQFNVIADDGTSDHYEIPIEYYEDFEIAMYKYSRTKETK